MIGQPLKIGLVRRSAFVCCVTSGIGSKCWIASWIPAIGISVDQHGAMVREPGAVDPVERRFHSVSRISPVSETRTSRVLPSAAFLPRIS